MLYSVMLHFFDVPSVVVHLFHGISVTSLFITFVILHLVDVTFLLCHNSLLLLLFVTHC